MDLKDRHIQLLILIIILALALRLYGLDTAPIRGDEGGTIFLSERPITQILPSTEDSQPPFFYAILHFWITIFGKSEFILRLLPVIFSILVIPVAYKLGKLLFDHKIGLFSAFIFAISQSNIRFAQNLRSYSLVTFLALLSFYFFYSYLNKPDGKNLIFFIITSALAVYAHYFAAFILIAEFLFIVLYYKKYRELFFKIFGAFVIIAILLLPLVSIFLGQISIKTDLEKTLFEQDPLTKVSVTSLNQNNLFLRIAMIFFHFGAGFLEFNLGSIVFISVFLLAIIVYSTSLLAALKSLYRQKKEKLILILLTLIIPPGILAALWITRIFPAMTYTRYFLYISPIYYILVAAGIFIGIMSFNFLKSDLFKKSILIIFILLMVIFNSVSLYNYYKTDYQKENWRSAAAFINEKSSPNEVIAIYSGSYSYNLNNYLTKDIEIYTLPENFKVRGATFSQVYGSAKPINNSNSCNILNLLDQNINGIWTVNPNQALSDPENLLKQCLDSNMKLADAFEDSYTNSRGEKITSILIHHYLAK